MTSEPTEEIIHKSLDYTKFTKEQCLSEAETLLTHIDSKFASKGFNELREHLDALVRVDREKAIKDHADLGKDVREFQAPQDDLKDSFYKLFNEFRDRRKKEKEEAEKEKLKNLKEKEDILSELRQINDNGETSDSLNKVRELQIKWKQIRQVPKEKMDSLWETYKVLLDQFYDDLSINRELKELDRDKNLKFKIDLIQKVDALKEEKNTRRAFTYLNKYHDEFKNTGPVPREHSEDIWLRFKAVSDEIIKKKNEDLEKLKEQQKENLKHKELLCEKVEQIAEIPFDTPKEWNKKNDEINTIFDEWKKIGRVPKANNDEIWERFRSAKGLFSQNKKKYFKKLNSGKEDNLVKKLELCEKAESVKDSLDFNKTADYLKNLQAEWKKIGPVPEKDSNKIWKRFRNACDSFFKLREISFQAKKKDEEENLVKKTELLEKMEALEKNENMEAVFKSLKELQTNWFKVGYVPFKKKKEIESKYDKVADKIYAKFNKSREDAKAGRLEEHYETLISIPNGFNKLKDEERKVQDKLRRLQGDIESYENNIQFFNLSKGSENFLNDFNKKIEKAHKGIDALKNEIKIIRKIKKANDQ